MTSIVILGGLVFLFYNICSSTLQTMVKSKHERVCCCCCYHTYTRTGITLRQKERNFAYSKKNVFCPFHLSQLSRNLLITTQGLMFANIPLFAPFGFSVDECGRQNRICLPPPLQLFDPTWRPAQCMSRFVLHQHWTITPIINK